MILAAAGRLIFRVDRKRLMRYPYYRAFSYTIDMEEIMASVSIRRAAILVIAVAALVAPFRSAFAGTSIVVTPAGPVAIDTTNQDKLAGQAQDISDLNGPYLADAFALANITGYPIGRATIGSFPHFEIGVAMGAGCTNMRYFADEDAAKDEGSFPIIAPNPVIHFGVGLAAGLDFIGKIFLFDGSFYTPDYETDLAAPQDISLYSIGGRLRYNLVERFMIVPFILSFGGVTVSCGADVMSGKVKVTGSYDTRFEGINVNVAGTDYPVNADFTSDYEADITWVVYSGTVNIVAFADLFTFFSFYSGLGLSAGSGYFKAKFNAEGSLSTTDIPPGTETTLGTMTFTSENRYKPHIFIPHYILGLEINLFVIKLNVETMVNLRNGEDVTALIGARFEI